MKSYRTQLLKAPRILCVGCQAEISDSEAIEFEDADGDIIKLCEVCAEKEENEGLSLYLSV